MKLNILLLTGILFLQLACIGQSSKKDFPLLLQESAMQCGPTCLQMVAKYYGKDVSIEELEINSKMSDIDGTSLLGLSDAADSIGLRTMAIKIPFKRLVEEVPLPTIVHWKQNHFVVVYHVTQDTIYVADPSLGKVKYSYEEFCEDWLPIEETVSKEGIALLLEKTEGF